MYHRIRHRKRWREFLSLLTALRTRWPGQNPHVVLDNSSPHKHPGVRAWATADDVEPVFPPTRGSWLNWIESDFAADPQIRTGPTTRPRLRDEPSVRGGRE